MSERDAKMILTVGVIGRPAKEKTSQFFGSGTRKPQRLNHLMTSVVAVRQELSNLDDSFRVGVQEAQKRGPRMKLTRAGSETSAVTS